MLDNTVLWKISEHESVLKLVSRRLTYTSYPIGLTTVVCNKLEITALSKFFYDLLREIFNDIISLQNIEFLIKYTTGL